LAGDAKKDRLKHAIKPIQKTEIPFLYPPRKSMKISYTAGEESAIILATSTTPTPYPSYAKAVAGRQGLITTVCHFCS
jgi:hypothetical protein